MSEAKVIKFVNGANPVLSNAERERLLKVARLREKVAKTAASERSAVLLADFEQQMATIYSFDSNDVWKAAYKAADQAAETAAKVIAAECERLGIPEPFRPTVYAATWSSRGQNAVATRRVELRKVAQTRIAAIEKQARTEIERISSQVQIELLAHGLSSTAQALLEQMPQVDKMMPTLVVEEIEAMLKLRLRDY